MYKSGDVNRHLTIVYENITIEHLVSYSTVLFAYTDITTFMMNNVTFRDVTNNH